MVFRVNKTMERRQGMTQFGRALYELNIEIICANSSQAKGRVERANGTLQDRLVKEMRLRGISTMAAGNAFLPTFMADYNARFAKAPRNPKNMHRPLAAHDDLDDALCLEGGAQAVPNTDAAIRQGAVHPRAERDSPSGWPARG